MESRVLTLTMLNSFIFTNLLLLFSVQESRQTNNDKRFLNATGLPLVNATLGDNVTLPCHFSTDNSMELTMMVITWSKDGKIKWSFSEKSLDNESVRENESLLHELAKGKADLHLVNIQQEDGGIYICDVKYQSLEEQVISTVVVIDPFGLRSTPDSRNVSSFDFTPTFQNPKDSRPPSTPASPETSIPASTKTEAPPAAIIGNDEFRPLKVGMVSVVLVTSWCLILLIYFFLPA